MNWNKIDVRIIYLVMLLAVVIPLLKPLGLPIRVTTQTQEAYDYIDSLKAGDIVWISYDVGTGSHPELFPQVVAIAKHLHSNNVRFALVSFWDTMAPVLIDTQVRPVMEAAGAVYGVDWVNLGYKPGDTTTMRLAVDDVWQASGGVDHSGTSLSTLPLMRDLTKLTQAALIISMQVGTPGTHDYISNVGTPYNVPILSGSATTMAANMVNNLRAGQIVGLLAGLPGGAEYEQLIRSPGRGSTGMDSQSFSHLAIIAFILLGNLGHYLELKKGGK